MGILAWIALGLIAGILAKALMPGADLGGVVITILLGIAGAILGGIIATSLGFGHGVDTFDLGSIVTAVIGAVVILLVYRFITGGRGLRRGWF